MQAINIIKRNFSIAVFKLLYQSENIFQRIQQFKQIQNYEVNFLPQLITPSYLHENKAKQILKFVQDNNIPKNIRILHALAHIEYNAFMSYVDTILRFSSQVQAKTQFIYDMRKVALQEGTHFQLLTGRLKDLGYFYGCMPVIPRLTNAIIETQNNILQRIAVISLIHEGRGVKSVKKLMGQLVNMNDHQSLEVVQVIQKDEVKHFDFGWKWFLKICQQRGQNEIQVIEELNKLLKLSLNLPQNYQVKYMNK